MINGGDQTLIGLTLAYGRALVQLTPFALLSLTAIGCGGSVRSQLPTYDPSFASVKAMELYDRNHDGKLAADELRECPALLIGLARIDQNNDRSITAEEVQARFAALKSQSDIKTIDLVVNYKRRPLGGATLTFTPEPFMGDGLQSYAGTTSDHGRCELIGTEVDLYGLPVGYYKVHVIHESQGIDAVQGCEIADDSPAGNRIEVNL
jgi:hypothetical protein